MKLNYSSLAAFLAHYRILKRAGQLTEEERERLPERPGFAELLRASKLLQLTWEERERLAEMTKLIELLPPADREAIESDTAACGRRSERALRDLRRLLAERGVLSG